MNKNDLLIKFDKDLRMRINFPEGRREITGDVVRFVRPAPGMNFVSFTFANESKLDDVIEKQLEYFVPMNQPLTWKVYSHDLLPSLEQRLVNKNFFADEEPGEVMIFDVRKTLPKLQPIDGIEIRRLVEKDDLDDVVQVLDGVYGNSNKWIYDRMGLHMNVHGYISIYGAYFENKPVSVAWTCFPRGKFATLFGGSTLPLYRGRGIYTQLLHTRINEIRERGYPYAIVETGSMSQPIVAKNGFQHLTSVWDYEWKMS